jgi:hypothetical protein
MRTRNGAIRQGDVQFMSRAQAANGNSLLVKSEFCAFLCSGSDLTGVLFIPGWNQ